MTEPSQDSIAVLEGKLSEIAAANERDFGQLVKIAGLDVTRDLRFQNWRGMTFAHSDLTNMDFTGSMLQGSNFTGAKIAGARFDQAVLGELKAAERIDTALNTASDWIAHCETWRRPLEALDDNHLQPGMIFQDAPFAPRLVVVPPSGFPGWFNHNNAVLPESREIYLEQSYSIGEFAVTTVELELMAHLTGKLNSAYAPEKHTTNPAKFNWDLANRYVEWLSSVTGRNYRIVSEFEWENAWQYGVFRDVPVHHRIPEWCEDHFRTGNIELTTDGYSWLNGNASYRVLRSIGATHGSSERSMGRTDPAWTFGLRVARDLEYI